MEFANVHLSVLRARVGLLQSDLDLLNLVLVLLLPPPCLLLRNLKSLLVFTDSSKLIFNHNNPGLSILHSFISTLQLILHHGKGTSQVVIFHLIVRSHLPRLPQIDVISSISTSLFIVL